METICIPISELEPLTKVMFLGAVQAVVFGVFIANTFELLISFILKLKDKKEG